MSDPYRELGRGYASARRPDPRIAAAIRRALGDARSVVNVGAGTGAYEPDHLEVVAVEPSEVMRAQRPPGSAPVIAAAAEALPLADDSVDAALAVLSMHHFEDQGAGLAEMRRVARRRVVLVTFDPDWIGRFWLVRDYMPEIAELDRRRFPPLAEVARALGGGASIEPIPIPHDCTDGFQGAFWRRPERYLDPAVRAGMSTFGLVPAAAVERGMGRLATDLESGEWERRNGELLALEELDLGYRLLAAELSAQAATAQGDHSPE